MSTPPIFELLFLPFRLIHRIITYPFRCVKENIRINREEAKLTEEERKNPYRVKEEPSFFSALIYLFFQISGGVAAVIAAVEIYKHLS